MSYQSILTKNSKVDFVKENYPEQIQTLIDFHPIITSAIKGGMPNHAIKFGGGTALAMYYFQHRLSFDIDLFILDRQYLSFFSPKHWIDDFDTFNDSEYIDQANHIGVVSSDNIKLDILIDPNMTNQFIDDSKSIFPFDIYIETIEDIISKKIVFRKKDNKTRDIFDIAITISKDKDLIQKLLDLEKITKEDLKDLYDALSSLNKERYLSQLNIIEPMKEYEDLSKNAPEFIIDKIKTMKCLKSFIK